ALRDRLLALHLLRDVRRSMPRGCDPHGTGGAEFPWRKPRRHVAQAARAPAMEPAARRGQTLPAEERMIETALLYAFGGIAALSAMMMLIARHPMRVALALVTCMLSLAGVYALLGVHVIAVFQVLIYVGAVMVFMVYVIMLIEADERAFAQRFSWLLLPGVVGFVALGAVLCYSLWQGEPA